MNTIGKRIRHARKSNNLSLTEVREITGLSTGNLSELENDKFSPSANALIAFRKAFNVSIDWILTGLPPTTLNEYREIREENAPYLSPNEKDLIENYRILDEDKKRDIQGYISVATHNFDKK